MSKKLEAAVVVVVGALLLTGCSTTPEAPETTSQATEAAAEAVEYPQGFDVADWSSRSELDWSVPATTVEGWTAEDVTALGEVLGRWTEAASVSEAMWSAGGDREVMIDVAAGSLPSEIGDNYREWQEQDTSDSPAGRTGISLSPGVRVLDSSRYQLDWKFEPSSIDDAGSALRGVAVLRAALHLEQDGGTAWALVQREHELTSTMPAGLSESAGAWQYNMRSLARNACGMPEGAVRALEADPWAQDGPAELASVFTRDTAFPDYEELDRASTEVDNSGYTGATC